MSGDIMKVSAFSEQVTICITMGLRPDLLRQTLESLHPLIAELPVLAVNDFGDTETNQAFADICPAGEIVDLGGHVGHHRAVDAMYRHVRTPYVMHLEDDWHFVRHNFIQPALELLEENDAISIVCLRDVHDFGFEPEEKTKIVSEKYGATSYLRLDAMHPQWHGFTFNPHISRHSDWSATGGFASFKKERHISRARRAQGHAVAYLEPGACHHIGGEQSIANTKVLKFRQFKKWLRGR
jgi:hypothetical protein